jgi:hypothetical protein
MTVTENVEVFHKTGFVFCVHYVIRYKYGTSANGVADNSSLRQAID